MMVSEPVQGQEAQSDKTGGDEGTVVEHWTSSHIHCLRQARKHYRPPTFKAINYLYVLCIVALSGRSWMETLAALYHSLSRYMNPWILYRQDRLYA
jgi:hypothetical protein